MTLSAESSMCHGVVSVSVVVFYPDRQLLASTLESLAAAGVHFAHAKPDASIRLYMVDNGGMPDVRADLAKLACAGVESTIISGHGNVGYGRGHNLAIERASSRYHLVLNPDVNVEAGALLRAIEFLDAHPEAGLLTPAIIDDAGRLQYLCRQFPALTDLFVRGFLPRALRRAFEKRLVRYEMRTQINEVETIWDPPIVSGCFMLFRTAVLKKLAGFDARYFLYFEDYDLSLRTHEVARVVYVPAVRVLHHGGGASRKGLAHIRMFVASAFKFYNRFGWKWL